MILPDKPGQQKSFTGVLTNLEDLDRHTVESVVGSRGQGTPSLLPYALNCLPVSSEIPTTSSYGFAWLAVLVLALPGWNILKAFQRMRDPGAHPIVKMLSCFGSPESIGQGIERESQSNRRKFGDVLMTENWLIVPRTLSITLIPLENLIWIFERVRGPFSPWTGCIAVPRARRSTPMGEYLFYARCADIKSIIDHIATQRPWIIVGWNPQIKSDMFGRRQVVITYVDERRKQYLAGKGVPFQHGTGAPQQF